MPLAAPAPLRADNDAGAGADAESEAFLDEPPRWDLISGEQNGDWLDQQGLPTHPPNRRAPPTAGSKRPNRSAPPPAPDRGRSP